MELNPFEKDFEGSYLFSSDSWQMQIEETEATWLSKTNIFTRGVSLIIDDLIEEGQRFFSGLH